MSENNVNTELKSFVFEALSKFFTPKKITKTLAVMQHHWVESVEELLFCIDKAEIDTLKIDPRAISLLKNFCRSKEVDLRLLNTSNSILPNRIGIFEHLSSFNKNNSNPSQNGLIFLKSSPLAKNSNALYNLFEPKSQLFTENAQNLFKTPIILDSTNFQFIHIKMCFHEICPNALLLEAVFGENNVLQKSFSSKGEINTAFDDLLFGKNENEKNKQFQKKISTKEKEKIKVKKFLSRIKKPEIFLEGSENGVTWQLIYRDFSHFSNKKFNFKENRVFIETNKFYRFFRLVRKNNFDEKMDIAKITKFEIFGRIREVQSIKSHFLQYEHDFDKNGLFYFLGSLGHTVSWQNPAETGLVKVTSSELAEGSKIFAICGRTSERCTTKQWSNAYFCIDLGEKFQLMPTKYTLRHYKSYDLEALRNWVLQGSQDREHWVTLSRHVDDDSLQKAGQTHSWEIPHQKLFFKMFRIMQTGLNSNKHYFLALSGIELYGHLAARRNSFYSRRITSVVRSQNKRFFNEGVLFYLGTKGLNVPWENPAKTGLVLVTSSSTGRNSSNFSRICSRAGSNCWTRYETMPWVEIRLQFCSLKPVQYSLRIHCGFDDLQVDPMREWALQASTNGEEWTELRHHRNYDIKRINIMSTFEVEAFEFFRVFRIVTPIEIPPNNNEQIRLSLANIEFFGDIIFDSEENPFPKAQKEAFVEGKAELFGSYFKDLKSELNGDENNKMIGQKIFGPILPKKLTNFENDNDFFEKFNKNNKKLTNFINGNQSNNQNFKKEKIFKENLKNFENFEKDKIDILVEESFGKQKNLIDKFKIEKINRNLINWDLTRHSRQVDFDLKLGSAIKRGHDDSWQIVLSKQTFAKGNLECEIEILSTGLLSDGWQIIVGAVPPDYNYNDSCCFGLNSGWGYISGNGMKIHKKEMSKYGSSFGEGDVIGIKIDFRYGKIAFYKNHLNQGIAFENIENDVRIAVCFNSPSACAKLNIISYTA